MKAELKMKPHTILQGEYVFEVWWGNQMVATVAGADGPGVRVISKHHLVPMEEVGGPPNVICVQAAL